MVNYKRLYQEACEHSADYLVQVDAAWQFYDELRDILIHAFGLPDDLTHDHLVDLLKHTRVLLSVDTFDRSITSEPGFDSDSIISQVNAWMNGADN